MCVCVFAHVHAVTLTAATGVNSLLLLPILVPGGQIKAAPDSPRQSNKTDLGHMEPFYLASVMSAESLPCHYLLLHALISASVAPWDTYNDGCQ